MCLLFLVVNEQSAYLLVCEELDPTVGEDP